MFNCLTSLHQIRFLNNIDIVEALKDNNAALRGVYDSHPSGEAEDLGVIYWGCTLSEEEKSKKRIEYNEVIINQFKNKLRLKYTCHFFSNRSDL